MIQILELHLEEPILVRFSVENRNRWRHHVLLLTKLLHHLRLTFHCVDHGGEEQHTWVFIFRPATLTGRWISFSRWLRDCDV